MDVRKVEGTDEQGQPVVAYVIPDGYCCCLISEEDAEALADWRECAAVRIEPVSEDGRVAAFEVARDLEWLTSEEGPQ